MWICCERAESSVIVVPSLCLSAYEWTVLESEVFPADG